MLENVNALHALRAEQENERETVRDTIELLKQACARIQPERETLVNETHAAAERAVILQAEVVALRPEYEAAQFAEKAWAAKRARIKRISGRVEALQNRLREAQEEVRQHELRATDAVKRRREFEEQDSELENRAATKLQSVLRGNRSRRETDDMIIDRLMDDMSPEARELRRQEKQQEAAAEKIQRLQRGRVGRKEAARKRAEQERRDGAAVAIQRAQRAKIGREQAQRKRQEMKSLSDCEKSLGGGTAAQGRNVALFFAVKNVDFARLSATKSVLDAVTMTLKESIAREADDRISPGQVRLQLSAGSILVNAQITIPKRPVGFVGIWLTSADAVKSKLHTSKTLADSVTRSVQEVIGIESAIVGLLSVSDIKVSTVEATAEPVCKYVEDQDVILARRHKVLGKQLPRLKRAVKKMQAVQMLAGLGQKVQSTPSGNSNVASSDCASDLRYKAKLGLAQAIQDGRFLDAVEKRCTQPQNRDIADLRGRAKEALCQAHQDGSLSGSIEKRSLQLQNQVGRAQVELSQASQDGCLQTAAQDDIVQQSAQQRPMANTTSMASKPATSMSDDYIRFPISVASRAGAKAKAPPTTKQVAGKNLESLEERMAKAGGAKRATLKRNRVPEPSPAAFDAKAANGYKIISKAPDARTYAKAPDRKSSDTTVFQAMASKPLLVAVSRTENAAAKPLDLVAADAKAPGPMPVAKAVEPKGAARPISDIK